MKSTIHLTAVFIFVFIGIFNYTYAQAPGDPVYYKGEIYPTHIFGSRCWMTKNINVGTPIAGNMGATNNDIVEKYCYNNDPLKCETYGGLYPWNEMMDYQITEGSQGICPIGWHIPTDSDWHNLIISYPEEHASDSLIVTGTSGFDALLGGYSNGFGGFYQENSVGIYFSSLSEGSGKVRRIFYGTGQVVRSPGSANDGYSVRCVRNSLAGSIPFAVTLNATNTSCNGGTDGRVEISLSGVSNPSFLWSNGATTEDLFNVQAGTYALTVTEAGSSITGSATVGEPTEVNPVLSIVQPIVCYNGGTGQVTVQCTGGTAPYLCVWSNGSTTSTLTNIAAGTYSVTVFDSNNCESIGSITITNPPLVVDFSSSVTMPLCGGGNGGAIDLIPNGTGTFTYIWNTFQSSQDLTGLSEGFYSVKIYNTTGSCTYKEFQITGPDPVSIIQNVIDVSEQGFSDGSIDVSVSGGTSPYSFLWSSGATTEDIVGISAGNYFVTITDANSCSFISNQILITEPGIDINYMIVNDVKCNGGADGKIIVNASTATCSNGCMHYLLSPGGIYQSYGAFFNLAVGTYSIVITDNAGGVALVDNIQIGQPDVLVINSITEMAGCDGANVTLNAMGGTPPFTYSKNGTTFQSSNIFAGLSAGTFTFYVKDSKDCQTSEVYTVSPVPAIAISGSVAEATCYGASNGSIFISVNNGTSPYTYSWSNGSTNSLINGLIAGNYSITVSDYNNCSAIESFTISEPDMILVSLSKSDVTYPSGTNGSVTVVTSGGFAPLSFAWSNGSNQQNLTGVSSGIYSVSVTDSHQCTTTASIQVVQDFQPITVSFSKTNVSCYGLNDGSAAAIVSGGNTPYSFSWPNGVSSPTINNLAAGNYTLTVTGFYGMTGSAMVSVIQPNPLQVNINPISNFNGFDVSCFSCNDGQVSATISGGTPPYDHIWSNGQSNTSLSGLAAGVYSISVLDSKNCTTSGSTLLESPSQINCTLTPTNVSCYGGSNGAVNANVSGGVAPYSYSWSTGSTNPSISSLPFGYYSVSVSDANGAPVVSSSISLSQPSEINLTANTSDISYPGGSNGSISLSASGGTTPYTYYWSNGATNQSISGLPAGNYNVTVTDQNICQQTGSYSLVVNYSPTQVNFNVVNVSCFGQSNGAIYTNVSGSQVSTYSWSNGASTANITNLTAGTYSLTTTNIFGMDSVWSTTVSQPSDIIGNININTNYNSYKVSCATCNDGQVTAYAFGGNSPYSFNWSTGGTNATLSNIGVGSYFVTITDVSGCTELESVTLNAPSPVEVYISPSLNYSGYAISCPGASDGSAVAVPTGGVTPYIYNWSSGATTIIANGLSAQIYSLTVTDQNGATSTAGVSMTAPPTFSLSLNATHNLCFNENSGAVVVNVNGGVSPFSYLWSNGASNLATSSLAAGNYTVTVTDNLGCSVVGNKSVNQPSQIMVQTSTSPTSCFGSNSGAINLTVTGGIPPYNYLWSTGGTVEDISNVAAGSFDVAITDGNSCTQMVQNITVGQPNEISTQMSVAEISSPGMSDGSVDMVVGGGTMPYSYIWSNGATTQNLANLPQAMYYVTIIDGHNCTQIDSAHVNIPAGLFLFETITHVTCKGSSNGQISVSVLGGAPPYSFLWSNGNTNNQADGLLAGMYFVTVQDTEYNITVDSFIVGQPDYLDIELIATPVSCFGGSNGSLQLVISGGTPPYSQIWSNNQTTNSISGLVAGDYTVLVLDANGCWRTTGKKVIQPSEIQVQTTLFNATDTGLTNGSASLLVTGGTSPYNYYWSNNCTSSSCNTLGANTYFVMILDAANCNFGLNFEIFDDPSLIVYGCMDPLALNYDTLANTSDNTCYYFVNPPSWTTLITSESHTILLPSINHIKINEVQIDPGDYIGVFFDSAGTLACGGYLQWLNSGLAITAWGDDPLTSGKDGFAIGESFTWKIWDASENVAYNATATYDLINFPNQGQYVGNGTSGIVGLNAVSIETQGIPLDLGWNMFSTYIVPFDPNIADVLSDIVNYVTIVKDYSGKIYWPIHGVNTIGNMKIGEAYQIDMLAIQVLYVEGLAVSPEMHPVILPIKWSMLGYLRQTLASSEFIMGSIETNVNIIKDDEGNIYWPLHGVNQIGNMIPGEGYQINMFVADTLIYPTNLSNVPIAGSKSLYTSSKTHQIKATDNNMTLGIPLSAWESLPVYGDEINVYSKSGLLVGSTLFTGQNIGITLWGDDELTDQKEGLGENENFVIQLESAEGIIAQVLVDHWIEGNETYTENKFSIVGKLGLSKTIANAPIELINVPNPFNTFTKIVFNLPQAENVQITIYNELGELITELANCEFSNGKHEVSFNSTALPSGIYFCKFTAGGFSQSHSMNLIK